PNTAPPVGPIAASPAPVPPDGPPPPSGGLPMPSLDVEWRPPSAAAGDVEALAAALAVHSRVGLVVDPSIGDAGGELDAMRLAALVGRLAPNTAVRPIDNGSGPSLTDLIL